MKPPQNVIRREGREGRPIEAPLRMMRVVWNTRRIQLFKARAQDIALSVLRDPPPRPDVAGRERLRR
jgi:hypothetical protein